MIPIALHVVQWSNCSNNVSQWCCDWWCDFSNRHLWLLMLILHKVLLHGLPSPSPSLYLSLKFFHVATLKKNCCGLLLPFINNLKTCTLTWCVNNKCKDKMKKLCMIQDEDLCDMFKPFHLLSRKGLRRRGYPKWSAHWLIIWHPLVKIDKLPMLVGAKMYTFVRFYLCNVSLSFHIIYCC
jgi:hypothetical protein